MTPRQIQMLREKHGLTREQFGKLLWQTERAVKAWEYGERNFPDALKELAFIKLKEVNLLKELRGEKQNEI